MIVIAHAILKRRGDKEEPVALLLRQGPSAIAATIGALKSGKTYVPLEPNQPVDELQQIIAHCQPTLIISDSKTETLSRLMIDDADRHLNVERSVAGEPEIDPDLDLLPDRICYIFYTSGTTGQPKGVYDNHPMSGAVASGCSNQWRIHCQLAEQARFVQDGGLVTAGCGQSQFQCVGDIPSFHRGAELPGDDVAGVIVQDRAEIEPAPSDHLQIREVGLP